MARVFWRNFYGYLSMDYIHRYPKGIFPWIISHFFCHTLLVITSYNSNFYGFQEVYDLPVSLMIIFVI